MSLTRLAASEQAVPVGQLLGSAAVDVVSAAVGDATVRELTPTQVRYRPDESVTVTYRAAIDLGTHTWRGLLVAYAGPGAPDVPTTVTDGDVTIAVWRVMDDPSLPGLRTATDMDAVGRLLHQVGLDHSAVRLRIRSYRPRRRAVVEAVTTNGSVFIKVVRPDRSADVHHAHVGLQPELPVPPSLGWSEELGVVVLGSLPGRGLRDRIRAGGSDLPPPGDVVGLLDRFPEHLPGARSVRSPTSNAPGHAALLSRLLPEITDDLRAIIERVQPEPESEGRIVHGDFHPAQLLVEGSQISGLVDIDGAGIGSRADDLATMVANLAVITATGAPATALDYLDHLTESFSTEIEPDDLARRAAAATLGYATGPFRTCDPNWPDATSRLVSLAGGWLESASRRPFAGPRPA